MPNVVQWLWDQLRTRSEMSAAIRLRLTFFLAGAADSAAVLVGIKNKRRLLSYRGSIEPLL